MLKEYIKGKLNLILFDINVTSIIFLILGFTGTSLDILFVLLVFKTLIVIIYLLSKYYQYRQKMIKINKLKNTIDKAYYLHELIKRPKNEEIAIYYDLMVKANQDMVTELSKYKSECIDYREYIEEWIHEMKTPLTTLAMLNSDDINYKSKLNSQLKKLSDLLETSLYYICCNDLQKDYQVEKIKLNDLIHKVILKEKELLISKKIKLEVNCNKQLYICSDEKWLSFMIHQILLNSTKYVDVKGCIKINVIKNENNINLEIWDNGCGIEKAHIPRIFDKGFTGAKGLREKSSGIGLYLVKKSAGKMGINVFVESIFKQYTKITLSLPINSFLSVL